MTVIGGSMLETANTKKRDINNNNNFLKSI